jgi:excinuclease UvrABC nuclease subunit
MKNNKSPGQDGLPAEFYKTFWVELKDEYFKSLLKSIECGMLPFSQRNAIISLIYKKGDKDDLKNYRPISLTNVDYKIFAQVLARRLQKVAKRIIFILVIIL